MNNVNIISDANSIPMFQEMLKDIETSATLINLEMLKPGSKNRQALDGFQDVITLRHTKDPVIITGFLPKSFISKDKRWLLVSANTNFVHLQLPFGPEDFKKAIESAGKGISDQLAGELYDTNYKASNHQILQHRLGTSNNRRDVSGSSKEEWIQLAQSVFGLLSFEELVKAVDEFKEFSVPVFSGREFPDVCVDVEGTLLNADGTLNQTVVDLVKVNAGTKKPITVWTGGNVYSLEKELHKLGIVWKVASKHLFKGAKFSVVIDDLPEEEFKAQYGIEFEKYIQI